MNTLLAGWRRVPFTRRQRLAGMLFVLPALIFVAVFFLYPVVTMAWMSLHDWPLFGSHEWVGLENYQDLFSDKRFLSALVFSIVFVIVAVPITVLLGLALAFLVKDARRGVAAFRSIYFVPLVIGFAAASYIWMWLLNADVGIVNRILTDLNIISEPVAWLADTKWAVVSALTLFVWKTVGFSMLLLMGGLQSIPGEIKEASAMDGAGRWRTFRSITIPMMSRTIALVLVFSTVGAFLVFEPFFILTQGGPGGSTIGLVQWVYSTSFFDFKLGYGTAASFVMMVILACFTAFQLRAMREEAS